MSSIPALRGEKQKPCVPAHICNTGAGEVKIGVARELSILLDEFQATLTP